MGRALIALAATVALVTPALGDTLADLVPQNGNAERCWQRIYTDQHLAEHPDQLVTAMTLGAGFQPDSGADGEGLTLFGMSVDLRGGKSGVANGGCWMGDGQLRCGVDCDGGSVVVDVRDDGRLLIDLEATGYIRLEGECGGGEGLSSFPLEPGRDDKQFLLSAVDAKICKGLVPTW